MIRLPLELLRGGVEAGQHLGGQLYASRSGEVLCDEAFGEARPYERMTAEHLVPWLSAGKPVTAVAVGQLWERGQIRLDDPVSNYLPEFGTRGKENITIWHLLTHTAGIRALSLGWPAASWGEILERIYQLKVEPRWTPGRKAGYHLSSSWFVLGELVRRVDGRPIQTYVRREIFEPAGMKDSWIGMPIERYETYGTRIAPAFDTSSGEAKSRGWESEPSVTRPSPGSNARGPIRELGLFYEALADDAKGAGILLKSPTVIALTAPHRVGMHDHTFKHVLDWGLGFVVNSHHYGVPTTPYGYGEHASPRTFGHSGDRSTVAFLDLETDVVVALAVNGMPDEETHRDRFHRVLTTLYEEIGLGS